MTVVAGKAGSGGDCRPHEAGLEGRLCRRERGTGGTAATIIVAGGAPRSHGVKLG